MAKRQQRLPLSGFAPVNVFLEEQCSEYECEVEQRKQTSYARDSINPSATTMTSVIVKILVILTLHNFSRNFIRAEAPEYIENYVRITRNVLEYYSSSCIIILHNGFEEVPSVRLVHSLSRLFSKSMFFTSTVSLLKQNNNESQEQWKICDTRPVQLVLLRSSESVTNFARHVRISNIDYPIWLILSTGEAHILVDALRKNPEKNILGLTEVTEMLHVSFNERTVYEWYLQGNRTTTDKLGSWNSDENLVLQVSKDVRLRRNSLYGKTLKVGMLVHSHYASWQLGTLKDLFGELLYELSKAVKFNIQYVMENTEAYGSWDYGKKKWSGVMYMLTTKQIDLAGVDLRMTTERLRDVDFAIPVLSSADKLYIKRPDEPVPWTESFRAFSPGIWATIGILVLTTPILLTIISLVKKEEVAGHLIIQDYLQVLGIYCQQGLTHFPKDFSSRLAYFSIFISSLITYAAYSGTLVSSLAVSTDELPFNSLEEFAAQSTYKFIFEFEGAIRDMFVSSTDPVLRKMYSMSEDRENLPRNQKQGFTQVCNGNTGYYVESTSLIKMKLSCEIASVNTGRRGSIAMALQKHSPYRELINRNLQKFRENGIIDRLITKYFVNDDSNKNVRTETGFWSIALALALLGSGTILSCVILLIEVIIFHWKTCGCWARVSTERSDVNNFTRDSLNQNRQRCMRLMRREFFI